VTTHTSNGNYRGILYNIADTGFHTYGCKITDDWIIMYFDRKEIARFPALRVFKLPVYMIVSLAMYSTAGAPQVLDMEIDYVQAWRKRPTTEWSTHTIVGNGGFQSGELSYWGITNAVSALDQTPRSTSKVAKVSPGGTVHQNVVERVKPGEKYRLTGILKVGAQGEVGEFGMRFISAATGETVFKTVQVTSTSYQNFVIDFTMPSGASWAGVMIRKPSGGGSYLYADDVRLVNVLAPDVIQDDRPAL
jgi:hypothetical protein